MTLWLRLLSDQRQFYGVSDRRQALVRLMRRDGPCPGWNPPSLVFPSLDRSGLWLLFNHSPTQSKNEQAGLHHCSSRDWTQISCLQKYRAAAGNLSCRHAWNFCHIQPCCCFLSVIIIIHSFYLALLSALEQTHCAHWHAILNDDDELMLNVLRCHLTY